MVEDAQPIPQRNKYGRIYSQSWEAIWARNYRAKNPGLKEIARAWERIYMQKHRDLKRARLEAIHSDQLLGL